MGCSKSNPKREFYSNTILPQETRNRQPNFTSKTIEIRRTKQQQQQKQPKLVEGNIKIWAEINERWKKQ